MRINKAVFLDRDGVIIIEPPDYPHRPKDIRIYNDVSKAIILLNKLEYKIVIVTNQAGIAKNLYSEKDVILFHKLMKKELELDGCKIDSIYFCPHHPEGVVEKYRKICDCRKPNIGMLLRAQNDLNIDFSKSYLIGDKCSDIHAGKTVGCHTILVLTGHGQEERKNCIHHYIANDLYNAVEYINIREYMTRDKNYRKKFCKCLVMYNMKIKI